MLGTLVLSLGIALTQSPLDIAVNQAAQLDIPGALATTNKALASPGNKDEHQMKRLRLVLLLALDWNATLSRPDQVQISLQSLQSDFFSQPEAIAIRDEVAKGWRELSSESLANGDTGGALCEWLLGATLSPTADSKALAPILEAYSGKLPTWPALGLCNAGHWGVAKQYLTHSKAGSPQGDVILELAKFRLDSKGYEPSKLASIYESNPDTVPGFCAGANLYAFLQTHGDADKGKALISQLRRSSAKANNIFIPTVPLVPEEPDSVDGQWTVTTIGGSYQWMNTLENPDSRECPWGPYFNALDKCIESPSFAPIAKAKRRVSLVSRTDGKPPDVQFTSFKGLSFGPQQLAKLIEVIRIGLENGYDGDLGFSKEMLAIMHEQAMVQSFYGTNWRVTRNPLSIPKPIATMSFEGVEQYLRFYMMLGPTRPKGYDHKPRELARECDFGGLQLASDHKNEDSQFSLASDLGLLFRTNLVSSFLANGDKKEAWAFWDESLKVMEGTRLRNRLYFSGLSPDKRREAVQTCRRWGQEQLDTFLSADRLKAQRLLLMMKAKVAVDRDELIESLKLYSAGQASLFTFQSETPLHMGAAGDTSPNPKLDLSEAFIAYVPMPDGICIYLTDETGEVHFGQRTLDWVTFEKDIQDYLKLLGDPKSSVEEIKTLAQALSSEVFPEDLRSFIAKATKIGISALGPISLVPFQTLLDGSGHYLLDGKVISYSDTIASFKAKTTASAKNATVVGGVDYGTQVTDTYRALGLFAPPGRLAFSESEAKEVSRMLNVSPILGSAASESNVRRSAEQSEVIHLATHGQTYDETVHLGMSGLLLTPSKDPTSSEGDGIWQGWEVALDPPSRVKLAYLSACSSGRSPLGPSSLVRAFQSAGAATVIATRWRLNDEAGVDAAKQLFKGLIDGKTVGEAWRDSIIAIRATRSHPYYWANVSIYGSVETKLSK